MKYKIIAIAALIITLAVAYLVLQDDSKPPSFQGSSGSSSFEFNK